MKNLKYINYCWYLAVFSIAFEYISKDLFLLEISSFCGMFLLYKSNLYKLAKKDILLIFLYLMIILSVYISRIFFTPYISEFENISFCIKNFIFFSFCYLYLSKIGFNTNTLIIISVSNIPHFILSLTGKGYLSHSGQFGGFHNDPNYLAPDLIASACAQLSLITIETLKKKYIYIILFIIDIYLFLIAGSRTAILSLFIIILIFTFFNIKNFSKIIPKILLLTPVFIYLYNNIINFISNNKKFIYLYNRFFNSDSGGDLIENERYKVWDIAYKQITEGDPLKGIGEANFLSKFYYFGVHNSWLDMGIRYGYVSFWISILIFLTGILILIYKLILIKKNYYNFFLYAIILSEVNMFFSISVSFKYYFWFIYIITILVIYNYSSENLISKKKS